MANYQKTLLRVAEWLELPQAERQAFIETAQQVSNEHNSGAFTRYDEEYFTYLTRDVLTESRVIELLKHADVEEAKFQKLSSGEVAANDIFRSWNEIQYSANEILDFTMLLKLVHSYAEHPDTKSAGLDSRYRLQKLVFLVNRKLGTEERIGSTTSPYDHGKLEKTGFRYTYRKRDSGPFSKQLQEDRRRLYASNLLNEEAMTDVGTPEINEETCRFKITVGRTGEVVMSRFSDMLEGLETDILADWKTAIDHTIDEYAGMSITEFHNHVTQIDEVNEKENRGLLLRGRRVEYDSEPWVAFSEQGGITHV